jgi:hypothetical protein
MLHGGIRGVKIFFADVPPAAERSGGGIEGFPVNAAGFRLWRSSGAAAIICLSPRTS